MLEALNRHENWVPVLCPITVIQNRCLKIDTGALYSTQTETLEIESGIYPLEDHFDKVILFILAILILFSSIGLFQAANRVLHGFAR